MAPPPRDRPSIPPLLEAESARRGSEAAAHVLGSRLRWVAGARAGVLVLLGASTVAAFWDSPGAGALRVLLWTVGAGLAASVVYLVWLRTRRALAPLGATQIFGDLLLWSVVVALTGGAESSFSVLFHLSVLVAAFLFGSRGAALAAGCGAILFGATSVMLQAELIVPPPDVATVTVLSVREVAYYLAVNTAGLGVVAALSGYLAERERRAGGELAEARRTSADLAALNDDVVRSLTSGLAATDREGTVLWINPAGAEILGRSQPGVVGKSIADLLPAALPRSASDGPGREEASITRPNGDLVHLGYRLAPLLDGDGEVRGSLLVFQDLTELRTMREKVERAERLAGLGRFAAAMAHELRNPLGSISGSLEMLKETPGLGEEDRHLADIVLREVDRLSALVTQMLEMSRPRPPQRAATDLAAVAREVATVIGASAEAEDLELRVEVPETLVASVDGAQVRQLLWNLLRNAAQATPPGGQVRLAIAGSQRAVVVEVEDSGPGVPGELRERLFDAFVTSKPPGRGTGLGLYIASQLVRQASGTLALDPGARGGTRAVVELPRAA